MSDTPNLALPYLAADQAQKHVTLNESLRLLDALAQIAVEDRDLAAPPPSPADGARWLVAGAGAGEWAGHGGELALREDGAWRFLIPRPGWLAYVVDESLVVVRGTSGWTGLSSAGGEWQGLARLGLGTTADATNPFAAKLNKALWTARPVAEGGDGDLRYTLNKETAADTLSLLFQSGYSGRCEAGLVGDDAFVVKMSADGAAWTEALRIAPDGKVGVGTTPSHRLHVAGAIGFKPGAGVAPAGNGEVVFELTSNTALTVRARGSDGVVRAHVLALA